MEVAGNGGSQPVMVITHAMQSHPPGSQHVVQPAPMQLHVVPVPVQVSTQPVIL
jgi:hypothetical protein